MREKKKEIMEKEQDVVKKDLDVKSVQADNQDSPDGDLTNKSVMMNGHPVE